MNRPVCIFCPTAVNPAEVVGASARFYAKADGFPLSPGHTLIIPRHHVVSLFELTAREVAEAYDLLATVVEQLEQQQAPDGYNVGVNDGRAAGRTIDHLHIHLIPRYSGDVPDPRGGVRNILPGPSPDLWSERRD